MKHLRWTGMAILTLLLAITTVSCSEDEDEFQNENSAQVMTGIWKIMNADNLVFVTDEGQPASYLTFTKDGEVMPLDSKQQALPGAADGKTFYTLNGMTLQVDLNCTGNSFKHSADDFMRGTVTMQGNELVFDYYIYDRGQQLGDSEKLVLKKVKAFVYRYEQEGSTHVGDDPIKDRDYPKKIVM